MVRRKDTVEHRNPEQRPSAVRLLSSESEQFVPNVRLGDQMSSVSAHPLTPGPGKGFWGLRENADLEESDLAPKSKEGVKVKALY